MDELLNGLKSHDIDAFNQVMAMYKNKIFNYLKLLVSDYQVAEELTQDTFVKVYFKAHTIKGNNLKAWIYTVATNLARSEFRKRKVRRLFSSTNFENNHPAYHSTICDDVILEQLLETLPEKYRVPLVMKEIDNFSFEEISAIMKKPVGTIKTLVFRSKEILRKNGRDKGDQHG